MLFSISFTIIVVNVQADFSSIGTHFADFYNQILKPDSLLPQGFLKKTKNCHEIKLQAAFSVFFRLGPLFVDLNFLWDYNWNISQLAPLSKTSKTLISNKYSADACS